MAIPVQNEKGFLIIQMNLVEAFLVFDGGAGICDECGNAAAEGFYVAVLDWYMCPECFNKWIKRAVHYTEDYRFEKEMFSKTKKRLSKLGMWNNEIYN